MSRTQRGVLSKRTLSAVSHALEMAATALGPDAVVIGAFERRAYFEPRAHAYRRDKTADTAIGSQVCQFRPFVFDSADKALYAAKNATR